MSIETENIKGSLDTIMSAVRTRDYKRVSELIEEIKKAIEPISKNLEELNTYKEFFESIKRKTRNTGRSSMISIQEIDEDIFNTDTKLKEKKNAK